MKTSHLLAGLTLAGAVASVTAQKSATDAIDEYRAMLADGNPAELIEAKGEDLWKQKRGPKNASLESCDLGKGPGVVKGAFVELPRYFADTGKVQGLESRLATCMERLQGLNAAEILKTPWGKGEKVNLDALTVYVTGESRGMTVQVPQGHAMEREFYELGRRIFYTRGGTHDFACATCHGEDGKRIRLQDLPNLTKNPGNASSFPAWPAYRVSTGDVWTMERRLNDCFRQQRFPEPDYGSDVIAALTVYLGVNANGSKSTAPSMKR
jgi:sulfur-oxidizing protein SoxA